MNDIDAAGERCSRCGAIHAQGAACPAGTDPAAVAGAPDPLLGTMVGSFRVQRLLGRGGMGSVYLAEHPVIGSKVAIKFLHESLATNPELVGRFYDEARAVNLIGHDNIVAIFDLALLPPGRYFIVMEYLEGRTLASVVRSGPVPQELSLDVLAQLTDALHAAHERGVVHRDLKPENVFLIRRHDSDHFVKLVDFGIAKLGDRSRASQTAAGMIVGTPEYMAPEQCDNRSVDARTDIYALGVMAYEVATGQLPFAARSIPQVMLAHLRTPPAPPRTLRPGIHPAFERVILKALQKAPEDRYPDMRAMGEDLRAALQAAGGANGAAFTTPTRAARIAVAAPAAPTTAPAAASPAPPAAAAPASPATPVPPPVPEALEPPAPPRPEVRVEVRASGASRKLRVADLSRGGILLSADSDLPPLFSKVVVILPGDGGKKLPVSGDVVRHIPPAQAAAWNMEPGFAVQLGSLGPEERAASDALAARLRAPAPTPAHHTLDGAGAIHLLESLERRALAGHYDLLDAAPGAGLPEVRERARGLRRQVEDLRMRLPPQAQVARVSALIERIEQAAHVLGTGSERLLHDAHRGNFRGVAHCVTAGVPPAVVESRRRSFLAEHPGQEAEAQRRLARSRVAHKMGNLEAALAELEAALRADPLNLSLHELHAELEAKARLQPGPA